MLLVLVTSQRTRTIAKLNTSFMQELPDKLVFTIRDTLKTGRPGKHLEPIHILAYDRDPRLCPVTHIKEYLAQTQAIRTTTYLLISYKKKQTTAVTNSTVAKVGKIYP